MSADDRISGSAKRTIIGLLNQALRVEYVNIVNFPRIIDQLTNMGRISDEITVKRLRFLGEDSVRHYNLVMTMVGELGGTPLFDFTVFSQITDIDSFMLDQMEKEKSALSLYQQAKSVAERSGVAEQSKIISALDRLANDEKNHIMRLQNIISALDIQTEK